VPRGRVEGLYYITHIDNLPSIMARGVLCHHRIDSEQIPFTHIYDAQIVANRSAMHVPDGRSLWEFANLYFQPRNAMLYRVLCEKSAEDVVVLAIQPTVLNRPDIFISTGNAASPLSEILPASQARRRVPQIKAATDKKWWTEVDGSKREMMAECLVPDSVPSELIQTIYVASHEVADKAKALLGQGGLPVIPEPEMFFEPSRRTPLTRHLFLVEGDLFFSRLHTLTVSVNCVGVMGKGLASRAKYQFPDVYVFYQDLCRRRTLGMGRPYLYKRESSFDNQLADEPSSLSNSNLETWFLLFPTKRDWRQRADIGGIQEGLEWLQANYRAEGIKSLAIPALGCGLGWLDWREVGPLLCRSLSALDIDVWLYLPAERKVPEEYLTKEFLLGLGI
jgi:hypothetical protein